MSKATTKKKSNSFFKRRSASDYNQADLLTRKGFLLFSGDKDKPADYVGAHKFFTEAIKLGSYCAMRVLGFMFSEGRTGFPQDSKQAVSLTRTAALHGDMTAQCNMGAWTEVGSHGLKADTVEAMKWYEMAAQKNCVRSIRILNCAKILKKLQLQVKAKDEAKDTKLDIDIDMHCYDVETIAELGRAYYCGVHGVSKDFKKAREFYKLGAEKNNRLCQRIYGIMLSQGEGGPIDVEDGFKWLKTSADDFDIH
jgi:uncharacterized protein